MFSFHCFHVRTDKLIPPTNDQWILVGGRMVGVIYLLFKEHDVHQVEVRSSTV